MGIACSWSRYIDGFHRSSGPSRSSVPRLSYVGIEPVSVGTGGGNPALLEADRRSMRTARADPADERRKFLVGSDIGQIMSKHNRAGQRTGDGSDDPGRRTIGVPAEQHCPLLGM